MNDPLLIWFSLIIIVALLAAMAFRAPNTFLFDMIRRLFYHSHPLSR